MQPFIQQPGQPLPMQVQQGVQQPVMFYQMPRNNTGSVVETYRQKQSRMLGVIQILIGVICIVMNGISIGIGGINGISFVGYGIWTGIMFIISGALGVAAGNKKTKCLIISFMVLCIISASFTTVLLSLGIVGAILAGTMPSYYERHSCGDPSSYSYYRNYYDYGYGGYMPHYSTPPPCTVYKVVIAMESVMAILALLEAIFAIWGSVICCKAVCCCSTTRCTNGIVFLPQYCCSNQQVTFGNPEQQPFQQVPYYVWPTPGPDGNLQFAAGPSMPIDPNSGEQWNPPPYYAPQVALPAYQEEVKGKDATQC